MIFSHDTEVALQAAAALVNTQERAGDRLADVAGLNRFVEEWAWTGSRRGDVAELEEVRKQAESLAAALAARKVIERAKGLLMEKESLTEDVAFARLRSASQATGRPLRVIAEAVIATFEAR